ncbi:hypothetical protein [Geodermatophilus sp. DSM 44513]|uniref:hypothetical protein n=1 Tax=Geodermatophilus sp. DSM 44513 TaxID=1528104 RepID=UPI00126F271C|nr:hypothetical protein [Geodermatophilus sp. DSM 44513]WNV75511.1 hypothetical protein RTG05_21435 [Geodermatophilus sp. DSM 44513]
MLRGAARRIALQQRDVMVRQRRWLLPLLGVLLVLLLVLALGGGGSPAVWLAIVLLSGLVAAHFLMARHLAQRAELLADPAGDR